MLCGAHLGTLGTLGIVEIFCAAGLNTAVKHPYFITCSFFVFYQNQLTRNLIFLSINLHINRHTAVVQHKLIGFADSGLQVIAVAPCACVKGVSKWRLHVAHWKSFTGMTHCITMMMNWHYPKTTSFIEFLHYIYCTIRVKHACKLQLDNCEVVILVYFECIYIQLNLKIWKYHRTTSDVLKRNWSGPRH